jgi:hypothetical protein
VLATHAWRPAGYRQAAGEVFHGAFTLALAEGQEAPGALRFAAAAASLKCARLGGGAAAPCRGDVEALLARAGDDGTDLPRGHSPSGASAVEIDLN